MYILKMQKKLEEMFSVFEILPFQRVAVISPIYCENICDL